MPELPEVETFRRTFEQKALDKNIREVEVVAPEILRDIEADQFCETVESETFTRTKRWGKFLFCQLSNKNRWMVVHFGMSGYFRYIDSKEDRHKHDRALVFLRKAPIVAFNCMRKFGFLGIVKNPEKYMKEKGFGPDIKEISSDEFVEALEERSRSLKSALLEQGIFAGLGNLYADESLFQARLNPKQKVSTLSSEQLLRLFETIQKVLDEAIKNKADYGRFPSEFFIHHRESDGHCPSCGSNLKREKVAGRTTFYCPSCQEF